MLKCKVGDVVMFKRDGIIECRRTGVIVEVPISGYITRIIAVGVEMDWQIEPITVRVKLPLLQMARCEIVESMDANLIPIRDPGDDEDAQQIVKPRSDYWAEQFIGCFTI